MHATAPAWLVAGILAGAGAACSPGVQAFTAPNWQTGDLLIAVFGSAGEDLHTSTSLYSSDLATHISGPPSAGRITVARIAASDLVHADGSPLSDAERAGVWVGDRAAPPDADRGACGRCVVPALGPPAVVSAGDRCQLPPFTELRSFHVRDGEAEEEHDPALEADVRRRLALSWPGPCACPLDEAPALGPELVLCPIGGDASFEAQFSALAEDGAVGAFSSGFALVAPPTGEPRLEQIRPALRGMIAAAALPGPGRRFLVAGQRLLDRGELRIVNEDLRAEELAGGDIETLSRIGGLARLGDRVLVLGTTNRGLGVRLPHSVECAGAAGALDCRAVPVDDVETCPASVDHSPLLRAVDLQGDAVAVSGAGALVARASGDSAWRCAGRLPATITASISLLRTQTPVIVGVGRSLLACVAGPDVSGGAWIVAVVSATVAPLVSGSGVALSFERRFVRRYPGAAGVECHSAFVDPRRPGEVVFRWGVAGAGSAEQAAAFGASGPPSSIWSSERAGDLEQLLPGAPGWPIRVAQSGAFSSFVYSGSVFRAPGSFRFTEVTSAPRESALTLAAMPGEAVAVFAAGAEPLRVSLAGGARCEDVRIEPLMRGRLETPGPIDAAATGADGRFLLFYADGDGRPWLGRLDPSTAKLEAQEEHPPVRVSAVAALGAERWLVLAADGSLQALERGSFARVESPAGRPHLAIDAAGGVGWAAGTERLDRVVPGAGSKLALEPWYDRLARVGLDDAPRREPPILGALRADCPDRLLISVKEGLVEEAGHAVDLAAWDLAPGGPDLPGWSLERDAEFEGTSEALPSDGEPQIGVFRLPGATFVYGHGTIYRPRSPRLVAPFEVRAATASGRLLVLTGGRGRLAVAIEPPR